jgi:hypothetical protein
MGAVARAAEMVCRSAICSTRGEDVGETSSSGLIPGGVVIRIGGLPNVSAPGGCRGVRKPVHKDVGERVASATFCGIRGVASVDSTAAVGGGMTAFWATSAGTSAVMVGAIAVSLGDVGLGTVGSLETLFVDVDFHLCK